MKTIEICCTNCNRVYKVEEINLEDVLGKEALCKSCNKEFTITLPDKEKDIQDKAEKAGRENLISEKQKVPQFRGDISDRQIEALKAIYMTE
ncbi:hypothetical protein QUF72_07930 [Desulfobacterales bacterium HSG2]|nr:hypothetical protein [Desulfobacterales bacterium HSG2]